ncbi:mitochondrial fission process protein 1-like isoform X1 [Hydractinia symbiolongicarpus]|uniref:mitochondrial fission process protein 1-like isoform X1 n=1 Tax=Hydractinia symbiolongicarpus TaxID=13093 RepID=UPI00254FFFB3|nr:mitochondrial fission process protein 1-like isoform X1 [Hydractinia symbiolongicarpus]
MNEKKKENVPLDYFRDTPVRYLGYANEVGEAFRQLIPVSFVRLSYVVASTYCLSDATSKAFNVKKEDLSTNKKSPNKKAIEMFIEAAVWQGLASVIIPGFTINRICWMSNIVIRSMMSSLLSPTRQKYLVTSIGLGCIPVIIKPIDRLEIRSLSLTDKKYFVPSVISSYMFINKITRSLIIENQRDVKRFSLESIYSSTHSSRHHQTLMMSTVYWIVCPK